MNRYYLFCDQRAKYFLRNSNLCQFGPSYPSYVSAYYFFLVADIDFKLVPSLGMELKAPKSFDVGLPSE